MSRGSLRVGFEMGVLRDLAAKGRRSGIGTSGRGKRGIGTSGGGRRGEGLGAKFEDVGGFVAEILPHLLPHRVLNGRVGIHETVEVLEVGSQSRKTPRVVLEDGVLLHRKGKGDVVGDGPVRNVDALPPEKLVKLALLSTEEIFALC